MAQTIAAGLDQKVEAAKSGSIRSRVKLALIRLARWRCTAKLVKLLFQQLVMEFCQGGAPSAEEIAVDGNGVPLWLSCKGLATRLGKSPGWVSKTKKQLGEAFADAIAEFDPDGYRWKWHEGKTSACDRTLGNR